MSWAKAKWRIKKFFAWFLPQAAASAMTGYAVKKGVEVAGEELKQDVADGVSIGMTRRF